MKRHSQQGVALVITLIMLSIITVITVAFLAVTTRETGSVANSSFQATTLNLTEAALERARAEVLAYVIANSNRLGPDMLVSINVDGAIDLVTGNRLAPADYDELAISELYQAGDPRAPVFVVTNSANPAEFRYWLDLDRNGFFTDTGFLQVTNNFGSPYLVDDGSGNLVTVTNFQIGDPQWIGVLRDPTRPHGRENRFVGRYAYIVLPVGRALDLNFIHNNAKRSRPSFRGGSEPAGFLRNQGVGSWEINLAAFLADLNTNEWGNPGSGYFYDPPGLMGGYSFDDATSILNHRYDGRFQNLSSANALFPATGGGFMAGDMIDAYSDGPAELLKLPDDDQPNLAWPGSDGVNHFFSLHEFFKVSRGPAYSNFVSRLRQASQGQGTYNETTYYRMLSMLATDSAPEPDKINLNYQSGSSTNLVEWNPTDFFLTVADRLLREEYDDALNVNHIPVYTNMSSRFTNGIPLYSPRVHQLLQIAANITDARLTNYYPSVFRPLFEVVTGTATNGVYIIGFEDETEKAGALLKAQYGPANWYDLEATEIVSGPVPTGNPDVNFYGIPTVIGAKKGFPSFNEITALTTVQVGRKLEIRKPTIDAATPNATNQMYIIGISNSVAVEAWNSYSDYYPRQIQMVVFNEMDTTLTNDAGLVPQRSVMVDNFATNYAVGVWPDGGVGSWPGTRVTGRAPEIAIDSFKVTPPALMVSLEDSVYYQNPPHFEPVSATNRFEANQSIYTNIWGMTATNKLRFFLYDVDPVTGAEHLVDMVAISDLVVGFDISGKLAGERNPNGSTLRDRLWKIDPWENISEGVRAQIEVSQGQGITGTDWTPYGNTDSSAGDNIKWAVDKFSFFLNPKVTPRFGSESNELFKAMGLTAQAPFTPIKRMHAVTSWEANDPLVQDLVDHLRDEDTLTDFPVYDDLKKEFNIFTADSSTLSNANRRFKPWMHPFDDGQYSDSSDANRQLPAVKDPGMFSSDMWNFPSNKFPSIGLLGRVHRGTPWQTIYLKSAVPGEATWRENVGAAHMADGDDMPTRPQHDWKILDMFTASLHPNATRGTLSVNQSGLAAWSAVLSGVPVTTVTDDNVNIFKEEMLIEPGANDPRVQEVVDSIKAARALQPHGRFTNVGSVLAAAGLTDASPFLNEPYLTPGANGAKLDLLTDEDYERIPQQILSLLKEGEARYVVYAFGQSLSPANRSVLPSGPFFGMCTNYQVTGESASRSVIQVEFDEDLAGRPIMTNAHARIERFNNLGIE